MRCLGLDSVFKDTLHIDRVPQWAQGRFKLLMQGHIQSRLGMPCHVVLKRTQSIIFAGAPSNKKGKFNDNKNNKNWTLEAIYSLCRSSVTAEYTEYTETR